ncbi:HAMP domain-containing protein, partial [bacterium]|nr:HAMP domain-containing protein [bacterium]
LDQNESEFIVANEELVRDGKNIYSQVSELSEYELSVIQSSMKRSTTTMIIVLLIGIVAGIFIAVFTTRQINTPLKRIKLVAGEIALGNLDERIGINQTDEIGELANSFREMQISLREKVAVAKELANGKLDIDIKVASNNDILAHSMVELRDKIASLIEEMNIMSSEHDKGDIDVIIPIEKFDGAFREMASGVNEMVNGHITVKKKAMACVAEFGKGNFDAELEKFPGKKAFINETIEQVRENLKKVIIDFNELSDAAIAGKLNIRANADNHHGDFKKIVIRVNAILDAIIKPVQEAQKVLESLSRNDLSKRVEGDYEGDHAAIKLALNRSLESLNEILDQVNATADQVSNGSYQVSDSSQSLSQGATEQASSLEEISSSMTEIAAQTRINAENALQAKQLADEARNGAGKGNSEMEKMLTAMKDISESSREINRIIKVIDEIAFQTNLLALNAAVEAARAGVHGKGFAVVADEVRNLAQRSATAAKETTELIEGSTLRVVAGTELANSTAEALTEIVNSITKVNDLVAEIAGASGEQAKGVEQINTALEQVDSVTQSNTASAEESAAAAEELSSQSAQLKQMLAKFELSGRNNSYQTENLMENSKAGSNRPAVKSETSNGNGHSSPKSKKLAPSDIISLDDEDFSNF